MQVADRALICTIRGVLKKHFKFSTTTARARRVTHVSTHTARDPVSVGDRVLVAAGPDGFGVIEEVLPRRSHFTRAGFRGREQTIVSNIDLLVIVFACAEPRLDPWKLDRFLVAAESEEIDSLIIANKSDLIDAGADAGFQEFRGLGYTVIDVSARTGQGIDELRGHLRNRIAAFVGPSGAGKSSILNALHPEFVRRTGEVGTVTYKGRHTTTASELLSLPTGGWVADTPGLRRLDLPPLPDRDALVACFPEFRGAVGKCRFDDCRHSHEPDCAIHALVDAGKVIRRRYDSYLALIVECENPRR